MTTTTFALHDDLFHFSLYVVLSVRLRRGKGGSVCFWKGWGCQRGARSVYVLVMSSLVFFGGGRVFLEEGGQRGRAGVLGVSNSCPGLGSDSPPPPHLLHNPLLSPPTKREGEVICVTARSLQRGEGTEGGGVGWCRVGQPRHCRRFSPKEGGTAGCRSPLTCQGIQALWQDQ